MKLKGGSLEQAMPMEPNEMAHDPETEGHMHTLSQAADIMGDPSKMQKVHAMAGRKHKALMGLISPVAKKSGSKIKSLSHLKKVANAAPEDREDVKDHGADEALEG